MNDWPWRAGLLPQGQWCLRSNGFVFQLSKQRVDLGQKFNQPKEIAANWTCHWHGDDHSSGMNQGTKKLTRTQNTLITMREAPRGHYLPWSPLEVPTPAPLPHFCPTWLIILTEREKKKSFGWFGLFSLHYFGFVCLAQRVFLYTKVGPVVLSNLRPRMPSSIFRQAGPSRWVCWGCGIDATKGCLALNFYGELLLERTGKVVIKYRVWRQLHVITTGTKAFPTIPLKD